MSELFLGEVWAFACEPWCCAEL